MSKLTCEKCGRTKEETMFYTYKDGSKPKLCKECTLMHVNIWEPETFTWLLQEYDVPWLPWEWDALRQKAYAKNPNKKNDLIKKRNFSIENIYHGKNSPLKKNRSNMIKVEYNQQKRKKRYSSVENSIDYKSKNIENVIQNDENIKNNISSKISKHNKDILITKKYKSNFILLYAML